MTNDAPASLAPPLAVGPAAAAEMIGTTRSNIYELIRAGEIRSYKLGKRRLIAVAELDQFVTRMAATGGMRHVDARAAGRANGAA